MGRLRMRPDKARTQRKRSWFVACRKHAAFFAAGTSGNRQSLPLCRGRWRKQFSVKIVFAGCGGTLRIHRDTPTAPCVPPSLRPLRFNISRRYIPFRLCLRRTEKLRPHPVKMIFGENCFRRMRWNTPYPPRHPTATTHRTPPTVLPSHKKICLFSGRGLDKRRQIWYHISC